MENIPNIFKYGVSKIKNKNVQRALESDVVEEAQNQTKNKLSNLFGGV